MKTMTVNATHDQSEAVTAFIEEQLEEGGCPYAVQMQMNIAADEIFTNIVSYAYESGGTADVSCGVENGAAVIVFSDTGVAYNPLEKSDPDITLSAEERQIGGLGIFMVKKIMDFMEYERKDGHNILRIGKRIEK